LCGDGRDLRVEAETLRRKLSVPNAERIFYLAQAFEDGMSIEEVFSLTKIDRWFLSNIAQVVDAARSLPEFGSKGAWSTGILPVGKAGVPPAASPEAGKMPALPTGETPVLQPAFRGVDPHADVHRTRRNLPHWEKPGVTY